MMENIKMALDNQTKDAPPSVSHDGRLHQRPYRVPYITFITTVLIFIFHIYISRLS